MRFGIALAMCVGSIPFHPARNLPEESVTSTKKRTLWGLAAIVIISGSAGAYWYVTNPWPDAVRTISVPTGHSDAVYLNPESRDNAEVHVDCFFPKGRHAEPLPAVIVLPGADGVAFYRRSYYRSARRLADKGFAVFVLRYFDPFSYDHLVYLDPDDNLDVQKLEEHIYGKHRVDRRIWIDTCDSAVAWVAQQPEVVGKAQDEHGHIFLLGHSLGGFVALCKRRRMHEFIPVAGSAGHHCQFGRTI